MTTIPLKLLAVVVEVYLLKQCKARMQLASSCLCTIFDKGKLCSFVQFLAPTTPFDSVYGFMRLSFVSSLVCQTFIYSNLSMF